MPAGYSDIPLSPTYSYNPDVITSSISAGLSLISKDMKIMWANKRQQDWFGPLSIIKGRHCYEVYQKRGNVCPGCPTAKVFKNSCDQYISIQKGMLAESNELRYFKITTSPVKDDKGEVIHVLELVEDVTKERKYDRKVKKRLNLIQREIDFISKADKEFIKLQDLSLDRIFQQAVDVVARLLNCKLCNLKLTNGAKKIFTSRPNGNGNNRHSREVAIKLEEALLEKTLTTKRPFFIKDLRASKYSLLAKYVHEAGLYSVISIPILLKAEVLGSLSIYNWKGGNLTQEDRSLLLCFSNHIAILIDDARVHKEINDSYLNTIKSLVSAVEARDPYSRGHSEKVTRLALDMAGVLGLPKEDLAVLSYCGRLHDIGKIGTPDSILNKPGPLTISEKAEIQLHPLKSVEMLSSLKFLESGIPAIRHHHERYDGKGYPHGLKGKNIPILARVIACADAFDAMTSDRAYRSKMSPGGALKELKGNRGTQFDPEILDALFKTFRTKRH